MKPGISENALHPAGRQYKNAWSRSLEIIKRVIFLKWHVPWQSYYLCFILICHQLLQIIPKLKYLHLCYNCSNPWSLCICCIKWSDENTQIACGSHIFWKVILQISDYKSECPFLAKDFAHTRNTFSSHKPNINICLISRQTIGLSKSIWFILIGRVFLVEHLLLPDPYLSGHHWDA